MYVNPTILLMYGMFLKHPVVKVETLYDKQHSFVLKIKVSRGYTKTLSNVQLNNAKTWHKIIVHVNLCMLEKGSNKNTQKTNGF